MFLQLSQVVLLNDKSLMRVAGVMLFPQLSNLMAMTPIPSGGNDVVVVVRRVLDFERG